MSEGWVDNAGCPHYLERRRYEIDRENEKPCVGSMEFSCSSPDGLFPEIAELLEHSGRLTSQFDSEFKPHPRFLRFMEVAHRLWQTTFPASLTTVTVLNPQNNGLGKRNYVL